MKFLSQSNNKKKVSFGALFIKKRYELYRKTFMYSVHDLHPGKWGFAYKIRRFSVADFAEF